MPAAVFLDRDDTLIDTTGVTRDQPVPGDLGDHALVRLLPGVGEACARLLGAGYALVVYSSQGGVARGAYGLREVEAVNDELRRQLARETGHASPLAGVYFCPYHPVGRVGRFAREHPWRKPGPAMITTACAELDLDVSVCWAVGDMPRDVQCAVDAGIDPSRALLVGTHAGALSPDLAWAATRIVRPR